MKRFLAMILTLCCMISLCFAEQTTTGTEADYPVPPLILDESLYDVLFDESDGSEAMVYLFIDIANDEVEEIEQYGACVAENYLRISEDSFVLITIHEQNSEFGYISVNEYELGDIVAAHYLCGDYVYWAEGGQYTHKQLSGKELDEAIKNFHFPYLPPDCMRGGRQDEQGLTYFLVRSSTTEQVEYVVADGMRVIQIRVYDLEPDGTWSLFEFLNYSTGEAAQIPESVWNEIKADNQK